MGDGKVDLPRYMQHLDVALRRRDYKLIDGAARRLIAEFPEEGRLYAVMADLAAGLGRAFHFDRYRREAERLGSMPRHGAALQISSSKPAWLVAVEWGFGFWSDVNHVLGSLLLAELTGRRPFVVWSENSLFSARPGNAWEVYFQQVSDASLADISRDVNTCFPDPWRPATLLQRDYGDVRRQRPHSTYGLALLPRPENVVVSDTFVSVGELIDWIEPGEFAFGGSALDVERKLARKYLRLNDRMSARVAEFWASHMEGRRWLAVHFRGGDKGAEVKNIGEINEQYPARIDALLGSDPGMTLFLLTDSSPFLRAMMEKYPGRVLATDALRSEGRRGVHRSGHDPQRVAEDVILDTYLAARCDRFLGNGTSNVSLAVGMLKDWRSDTYQLIGPDWRTIHHPLKGTLAARSR